METVNNLSVNRVGFTQKRKGDGKCRRGKSKRHIFGVVRSTGVR